MYSLFRGCKSRIDKRGIQAIYEIPSRGEVSDPLGWLDGWLAATSHSMSNGIRDKLKL